MHSSRHQRSRQPPSTDATESSSEFDRNTHDAQITNFYHDDDATTSDRTPSPPCIRREPTVAEINEDLDHLIEELIRERAETARLRVENEELKAALDETEKLRAAVFAYIEERKQCDREFEEVLEITDAMIASVSH